MKKAVSPQSTASFIIHSYFQSVGNRRITPSFLESDRQLLVLVDDNLSKIIETLCKRLFSEKGIGVPIFDNSRQRAKFAVL